jgi:hypothetical protein
MDVNIKDIVFFENLLRDVCEVLRRLGILVQLFSFS